jgi:amidase
MIAGLDADEIVALAAQVGIPLSRTEAQLFLDPIASWLESLRAFEELRIGDGRPETKYTDRTAGHRPSSDEDPYCVFITKCSVRGSAEGPLNGKTVGLKDNISLSGVPMTFGSRFMNGYIPDFDATIVTRILDSGAEIVGKLNMEDFSFGGPGFGGVGDFGRPKNPLNPGYVTGGSSSGSAAAVAAGEVDIAFGGDQGGSIRIPAAWCGVYGLTPTFGLIPHTGIFAFDPSLDFTGPLASDPHDLALALKCVAGEDEFDPRQRGLPDPLPDYLREMEKPVRGLRIGLLEEGFAGADPLVASTALEVLSALEGEGVVLSRVSIPIHSHAWEAAFPIVIEGAKLFFDTNLASAFAKTYYPTSLIETFGKFKARSMHELPPNVKLLLILGFYLREKYHGRLYAKSQNIRPLVRRQYDHALEEVDVLAMPTVRSFPFRYEEPTDHESGVARTLFGSKFAPTQEGIALNTGAFNFTGHPSLTVPCHNEADLPVGLLFVGPYFGEGKLLRLAHVTDARGLSIAHKRT